MAHITILGSLNYDLVTTAERVPLGGETVPASGFATHNGGKGANQALASQRLSGADVTVRMVGRVGQDEFGKILKGGLEREGVDVSFVETVPGESGVAVIIVEQSTGENRILVNAGANGTFSAADVSLDMFRTPTGLTDVLVLQNELPLAAVFRAIEIAHENGIKIVYNPSPMYSAEVAAAGVLSKVDYLVVNETELGSVLADAPALDAEDVFGSAIAIAQQAFAEFQFDGAQTIVVTLGSHGAFYVDAATADVRANVVPSFKPPRVVDTTGAGDSFLGAFVGAVATGVSTQDALRRGAAAGAIAVSRAGAAEGVPFLDEALALVEGA
ncbi:Ribokinase-like protein [Dipodascopsis tothii]|uniref:Ribokinase-like protein n=1 Tax=Dipodascopsis tothii TaxID=44089 RepID=UPI0034CEDBB9